MDQYPIKAQLACSKGALRPEMALLSRVAHVLPGAQVPKARAPVREVHLNRWTSSDTHTKPLIFPPKDEIMTHHQQASVNECITNDTSSSQESRHRQL